MKVGNYLDDEIVSWNENKMGENNLVDESVSLD
jgi:hypothetical protein